MRERLFPRRPHCCDGRPALIVLPHRSTTAARNRGTSGRRSPRPQGPRSRDNPANQAGVRQTRRTGARLQLDVAASKRGVRRKSRSCGSNPNRPMAAGSFVRSGLFHWYELGESDRHQGDHPPSNLCLRDESFFSGGWRSRCSNSPAGLSRFFDGANPGSEGAMSMMGVDGRDERAASTTTGSSASRRGRSASTNSCRCDRSRRPADLVNLVPIAADDGDLGLLQGILDELHRKPIDNNKLDNPSFDRADRLRARPRASPARRPRGGGATSREQRKIRSAHVSAPAPRANRSRR